MHICSSIALPALLFSSGLIPPPMIPDVAPGAQQQVQTKSATCWTLSEVVLFLSLSPSHASSAWWFAPETLSPYFLFDILVPCFFLTAVQPLLSDGLFCCLKHLIGGQVYIIRGESQSVPPREVLPCRRFPPLHAILMVGRKKVIGQHHGKIVSSIKS